MSHSQSFDLYWNNACPVWSTSLPNYLRFELFIRCNRNDPKTCTESEINISIYLACLPRQQRRLKLSNINTSSATAAVATIPLGPDTNVTSSLSSVVAPGDAMMADHGWSCTTWLSRKRVCLVTP